MLSSGMDVRPRELGSRPEDGERRMDMLLRAVIIGIVFAPICPGCSCDQDDTVGLPVIRDTEELVETPTSVYRRVWFREHRDWDGGCGAELEVDYKYPFWHEGLSASEWESRQRIIRGIAGMIAGCFERDSVPGAVEEMRRRFWKENDEDAKRGRNPHRNDWQKGEYRITKDRYFTYRIECQAFCPCCISVTNRVFDLRSGRLMMISDVLKPSGFSLVRDSIRTFLMEEYKNECLRMEDCFPSDLSNFGVRDEGLYWTFHSGDFISGGRVFVDVLVPFETLDGHLISDAKSPCQILAMILSCSL